MIEQEVDLLLEEDETGFFVNGIRVSEETYLSLADDLEANEDVELYDEEDTCKLCEDINCIIESVEEDELVVAVDVIENMLLEYYESGRADALEEIAGVCLDKIDEECE